MTFKEIDSKLEIPAYNESTSIKEIEAEFIHNFLIDKGIKKTLEVGFAYGRSACSIIGATKSKHIAIDPFQDHYKNIGLANIKSLGFEELLDFRRDYSHNILPKLTETNERFDFIFIDGDHKFDGILVDFYYSNLLCNIGGYILLHDTWMRSTQLVMKFIRKNRKDFKAIKTPLRNFALYQKVDEDKRNGMVFSEFYTMKSIITNGTINWLDNGKPNFFKKIVFSLKEKIK